MSPIPAADAKLRRAGRLDAFFLGGGQINGQANVNPVRVGDPSQTTSGPDATILKLLRARMLLELAATFPTFTAEWLGNLDKHPA